MANSNNSNEFIPYKTIGYTALSVVLFKAFAHTPPVNSTELGLERILIGSSTAMISGMMLSTKKINQVELFAIPITGLITDIIFNKLFLKY